MKQQYLCSQIQDLRKPFHQGKGLVLYVLFHSSNILLLYLPNDLLREACHHCYRPAKYSKSLPYLTQQFLSLKMFTHVGFFSCSVLRGRTLSTVCFMETALKSIKELQFSI